MVEKIQNTKKQITALIQQYLKNPQTLTIIFPENLANLDNKLLLQRLKNKYIDSLILEEYFLKNYILTNGEKNKGSFFEKYRKALNAKLYDLFQPHGNFTNSYDSPEDIFHNYSLKLYKENYEKLIQYLSVNSKLRLELFTKNIYNHYGFLFVSILLQNNFRRLNEIFTSMYNDENNFKDIQIRNKLLDILKDLNVTLTSFEQIKKHPNFKKIKKESKINKYDNFLYHTQINDTIKKDINGRYTYLLYLFNKKDYDKFKKYIETKSILKQLWYSKMCSKLGINFKNETIYLNKLCEFDEQTKHKDRCCFCTYIPLKLTNPKKNRWILKAGGLRSKP